jgi:CubicO group peptidase (beta-lactamase class C family)
MIARLLMLCLLLAPVALRAAATPGGDDAARLAAIESFVQAEMARQQVPGVAVAVVRGGTPVLARGFGLGNVEWKTPVSARTVFQSGSVGKQFTALLVMRQAEAGKLGLDDPLTRFFPDAPAGWANISVRHLLTHTSGIPDYTEGLIDMRRDYTEEEMVRFAFTLKPDFAPGAQWKYSNTGYVLLGAIVRKVTGRFYGDVLAEQVFRPLGMPQARIIDEAAIVPERAGGYRLADGVLLNQEWVAPKLNTTADGSLYVTLEDMLAWDRGLRAGTLLSPAGWQALYTPVRLNDGSTYPYGFGWGVDRAAGAARYHHTGSWQGFKTAISRYIGADLSIIVLANLAEANPARFVDGIARLIDPALAEPPVESP